MRKRKQKIKRRGSDDFCRVEGEKTKVTTNFKTGEIEAAFNQEVQKLSKEEIQSEIERQKIGVKNIHHHLEYTQ